MAIDAHKAIGATFATHTLNRYMKNYLAVLALLLTLWCGTPAVAQDSSRLNTIEHKLSRSERKEARLRKKATKQERKLARKEKKLSKQQKKTDRHMRKRNREQRKLQDEQRDSTRPSQTAFTFYKKEEPALT